MIAAHEKHLTDSAAQPFFHPSFSMSGDAKAGSELLLAGRRELTIEFAEMNLRLKGDLFGVESGHFILVKLAPCDFIGTFNSEFVKRNPVTVKYRLKDAIYGFESRVISIVSVPLKLMFLTYPGEIKTFNHHIEARYLCFLPAVTMANNEIIDMTIIDISKDGIRCVVDVSGQSHRLHHHVQINTSLEVRTSLPGVDGGFNFTGKIRNLSRTLDKMTIGINFTEMEPAARRKVENYLIFLGTRREN